MDFFILGFRFRKNANSVSQNGRIRAHNSAMSASILSHFSMLHIYHERIVRKISSRCFICYLIIIYPAQHVHSRLFTKLIMHKNSVMVAPVSTQNRIKLSRQQRQYSAVLSPQSILTVFLLAGSDSTQLPSTSILTILHIIFLSKMPLKDVSHMRT